jgi:hypothetical protein
VARWLDAEQDAIVVASERGFTPEECATAQAHLQDQGQLNFEYIVQSEPIGDKDPA